MILIVPYIYIRVVDCTVCGGRVGVGVCVSRAVQGEKERKNWDGMGPLPTEYLPPQQPRGRRSGIFPVDRRFLAQGRRNILPHLFQPFAPPRFICSKPALSVSHLSLSHRNQNELAEERRRRLTKPGTTAHRYSTVPSLFSTTTAGCAIPSAYPDRLDTATSTMPRRLSPATSSFPVYPDAERGFGQLRGGLGGDGEGGLVGGGDGAVERLEAFEERDAEWTPMAAVDWLVGR